ncbi:AbrB family looped-hinge helix DNA binding protein [Paenibacillus turicensis]|uniref:AbrB family looped-hinge helix DNA binding protein n=1 Tax=Paenibacillus turicensis TaxID=160487 RepID=A0ABS4FT28_9BACL|nr:AbrB/MazE/SpoVT family DNA-binding domain-containing protein [Paenibacillus turicensis]MBP1905736.1 AbrB family looped-hinge helix DNA binding protein [Paenibacillus turicensis]
MVKNNTSQDGKFMSTVKVGEKGQIVIPKGARDLFDIKPGDTLLLLADIKQGIAIVKNDLFKQFANEIIQAQENPEEAE